MQAACPVLQVLRTQHLVFPGPGPVLGGGGEGGWMKLGSLPQCYGCFCVMLPSQTLGVRVCAVVGGFLAASGSVASDALAMFVSDKQWELCLLTLLWKLVHGVHTLPRAEHEHLLCYVGGWVCGGGGRMYSLPDQSLLLRWDFKQKHWTGQRFSMIL